jgi:hypothetical protein
MPKLLVKVFGDSAGDVYDLQEAGNFMNFSEQIIAVNGKRVSSLEELIQIMDQPEYRDQEFIEITMITAIDGG